MFRSETYGEVKLNEILDKILEFYERVKEKDGAFQIVVGTDSQNFSDTPIENTAKINLDQNLFA